MFQEGARVSGACRPHDFAGLLRTHVGCLIKGRREGPNLTCQQLSVRKSSNATLSSFDVATTTTDFYT